MKMPGSRGPGIFLLLIVVECGDYSAAGLIGRAKDSVTL